ISDLSDRVAQIEARPGAAAISQEAVQQSLDPLAARLSELETRVASLAKAQSEIQTSSKATALALALYNLRRAANEGRPFAAELKSVAEMSPVPLDLAALEARRDQGVPSLKQLKTDFEAAANKAIDLENQPANDSFASELWSKAKSFIRIRRKGDIPGDTTRAILARAEYQLDAGNLKMAAAEAEQLQGAAAEAVKSWHLELKAKIAADEALAGVEAKLLTALGSEDAGKRGG
ncbi:MAG: mitofilin family membrane protein, partial [Rhodomicrobiaceae bacterium]